MLGAAPAATPPAAGRRPWRRSACRRSRPAASAAAAPAAAPAPAAPRARRARTPRACRRASRRSPPPPSAPSADRPASRRSPPRRCRSARSAGRGRRPARRRPARAAAGSRGAKAPMSTPGGPSRVRPGRSGSWSVSHSRSAVWREPTSTPRAPPMPRRAGSRKRSGCGATVYSSALPWILTAYGVRGSARARISGPITRWLASATSGCTRSATSRTGAHVGLDVRLDLGVAQLREGTRLDPLVAVGDVDRQQACERRAVDRAAHRLASRREPPAPRRPSRRGRRRTAVARAPAPGTAGGPRGPAGAGRRRGWRCRRWSPCRPTGSRGRSARAWLRGAYPRRRPVNPGATGPFDLGRWYHHAP